ncbi:hypothetical protein SUGI_1153210 [Cryptomeria japonica]|nr:hypothetical protein SUGI_1153210 [Cryptomeria japonica]
MLAPFLARLGTNKFSVQDKNLPAANQETKPLTSSSSESIPYPSTESQGRDIKDLSLDPGSSRSTLVPPTPFMGLDSSIKESLGAVQNSPYSASNSQDFQELSIIDAPSPTQDCSSEHPNISQRVQNRIGA